MSLILLNMKKEQLHRMVLSTFFVKNEFNICGFIFKQQWTLFQREGLCVCKMTRGRGSACGAHPEGVVVTQTQYYLCSHRWRGS